MNEDLFIRMARPEDVPVCREIDVEAWGEDSAATEEMLRSRIASYPFGNFVATERSTGEIVASVWTMAMDEKPFTTWWETSGEGAYGAACNPHGDLIFGVNVSVRPRYNGRRIGEDLVSRCAEAGWLAGKRKAVLGARIPEYHLWQDVFRPEDYIHLGKHAGSACFRDPRTNLLHMGPAIADLRSSGAIPLDPRAWPPIAASPGFGMESFDGGLAFFMDITAAGVPCRVFDLLPGYFPDPDSCDFGVLIGWENPAHPANRNRP